MNYDVIVVGAGPAGLAAALRLATRSSLRVCVLEKAARVGGHLLSGALLDPADLAAVVSDWPPPDPPPLGPHVTQDALYGFTPRHAFPLPRLWSNHGCRLVALGGLCRWMAGLAEAAGAEIYPGVTAAGLLWNGDRLEGVVTGDMGRDAQGRPRPEFQPGMVIRAPLTLLAEGCRGHLGREAIRRLRLDEGRPPQTYALGFKELWELPPDPGHPPGAILHTLGWPLDRATHGGGFFYRFSERQAALGWIVGLDYRHPSMEPLRAFQAWKTHPMLRALLREGRPVGFGARTLVEGGWQAMPRPVFAGGMLVGDDAGFLDAARLKGIGNAMRSGLAAADAAMIAFGQGDFSADGLKSYPAALPDAPWGRRRMAVRNVRPGFRPGLWIGLINAAWERLTQGRSPWTWRWREADRAAMRRIGAQPPLPPLPPSDGRHAFERSHLLALSALTHRADQPAHLVVADPALAVEQGRMLYANPETRYCPAGVFRIVTVPEVALRMQTGDCLHCKCCDIKDPLHNIRWTPPEGGSGPDYGEM
ncbi:MAG: 4Fe-4S dicluster domain-containing protein [Magnetococcales bacterium]|nr:4Fe-4S dicluster domain-containing protein [Magnetococcales bacterium]